MVIFPSTHRFYQELTFREEEQRDSFLEECISDPTLRDKLSLVTRSFKNRIKVAHCAIAFQDSFTDSIWFLLSRNGVAVSFSSSFLRHLFLISCCNHLLSPLASSSSTCIVSMTPPSFPSSVDILIVCLYLFPHISSFKLDRLNVFCLVIKIMERWKITTGLLH